MQNENTNQTEFNWAMEMNAANDEIIETVYQKLDFDFCYHEDTGKYYEKAETGNWIVITNEGSLFRSICKRYGIDSKTKGFKDIVDDIIYGVQQKQNVAVICELAGYDQGVYSTGSKRILIKNSPKLIAPVDMPWPTLQAFFEGLFDEVPRMYFYSWLKVALDCAYTKSDLPGQALVLAGPPGAGKSFAQRLCTPMFGDRPGKPYAYMTKTTSFNGDLISSEHLMIEDEAAAKSVKARDDFAASLKGMTVNEDQYCHIKFNNGIVLKPRWSRLTISVNEDPTSLQVIPPIDEGLGEKLMLLRVNKRPMPMATETGAKRAKLRQTFHAELPGFIYYLRNVWKIPADMVCARYGVKHYHDRQLLENLNSMSKEQQLLEMIDEVLFENPLPKGCWEGKVATLQRVLISSRVYGHKAESLLASSAMCGKYLSKLRRQYPERFEERHSNGYAHWKIKERPADLSEVKKQGSSRGNPRSPENLKRLLRRSGAVV